jgi:hypothetical protein
VKTKPKQTQSFVLIPKTTQNFGLKSTQTSPKFWVNSPAHPNTLFVQCFWACVSDRTLGAGFRRVWGEPTSRVQVHNTHAHTHAHTRTHTHRERERERERERVRQTHTHTHAHNTHCTHARTHARTRTNMHTDRTYATRHHACRTAVSSSAHVPKASQQRVDSEQYSLNRSGPVQVII